MKRDRLSIHISDSAEIFVEERKNGIKSCKCISLDDLLVCIKSSIREIKPVYRAVLPKNALFYSCCPETGDFSAAMEYPYNKADITYMNTEYRDFPLPKLVFGFKVAGKKIKKVYLGITGNGILRESSFMYTYPFSNVSKDFVLCTGGNALPEIKSPYSLSNMPDYILSLPITTIILISVITGWNSVTASLWSIWRISLPNTIIRMFLFRRGKPFRTFTGR